MVYIRILLFASSRSNLLLYYRSNWGTILPTLSLTGLEMKMKCTVHVVDRTILQSCSCKKTNCKKTKFDHLWHINTQWLLNTHFLEDKFSFFRAM